MTENVEELNVDKGTIDAKEINVTNLGNEKKHKTLKQSIESRLANRPKWQIGVIATMFVISTIITMYSIYTGVQQGMSVNTFTSVAMSIFSYLGTWMLAVQYRFNFAFNGIQNVFGIIVAGRSGILGDAMTSLYYLCYQVIGAKSWDKKRDADGNLQVERDTSIKVIIKAVFFWGIGLGFVSWMLGGKQIILDAITNSLAFVANDLQIRKASIYGNILWLIVDILSIIIFLRVGNYIVVLTYASMTAQTIANIVLWSKNEPKVAKVTK